MPSIGARGVFEFYVILESLWTLFLIILLLRKVNFFVNAMLFII